MSLPGRHLVKDSDSLDEQGWAFALRIYAEPDVAAACLQLQDKAGVDVSLLLTVAFACRRGIPLSPPDISAMDAVSRPWREQIVQPLRALRIALKAGPWPAPNAATEKLRTRIKTSELRAERLAVDQLTSWLQIDAVAMRDVGADELRAALRQVLVLASKEPDRDPIGGLASAIDTIATAAQRIAA